jgi:anthranilate phosphoribosyltransferase
LSDVEDRGGWPALLGTLTAGQDLDRDVARSAMAKMLAGEATSAQIAAFIVGLRMKGETVAELVGLREAMIDAAVAVPLSGERDPIDTCGTGGDRSGSINVSSIAALVAAGGGVDVVKHGNRAASSQCGSADLYEALGIDIEADPDRVAACVEETGFGFCFARRFHTAMRHVGPTRQELGVPTVFNVLGPLANPARVRRQVLGVGDPAMAERMLAVLEASGTVRAFVVHGHDGLDELTTTTISTVHELRDGRVYTTELDPTELGLERATLDDLRGGDVAANVDAARRILDGEQGPQRDVGLLNAAAAFVVSGTVDDLADGLDAARHSIDGGAAGAVLERVVEVSNR